MRAGHAVNTTSNVKLTRLNADPSTLIDQPTIHRRQRVKKKWHKLKIQYSQISLLCRLHKQIQHFHYQLVKQHFPKQTQRSNKERENVTVFPIFLATLSEQRVRFRRYCGVRCWWKAEKGSNTLISCIERPCQTVALVRCSWMLSLSATPTRWGTTDRNVKAQSAENQESSRV